jgi:hypothetical protein
MLSWSIAPPSRTGYSLGAMQDQGTSAKRLKTILLGLLGDSLSELRRFSKDLDIERVDREGGRIFMKDGRVLLLELKAEASIRGRRGPGRHR